MLSLPIIRRWSFEVFTNVHTLLAVATLVTLWLHLPSTPLLEGSRLYLLLCCIVFSTNKLLRYFSIIYSSLSITNRSLAVIQQQGEGVEVRIRMARPLRFKAGQYIYLSLWGLSSFSAFELHPFQICWAYQEDSEQQVLVLLAQPRRGFTRALREAVFREYRAFIEGPYGKPVALGQYGTVLLFATGVGITGQLPYVKELLELYHQCRAKTRRIALFWELDAEGKCRHLHLRALKEY